MATRIRTGALKQIRSTDFFNNKEPLKDYEIPPVQR